MFRRILLTAVIAGCLAGLLVSGLQEWRVTPLLVEAEHLVEGDHHGEPAAGAPWQPAEGLQRTGFTALANMLTGVGFALVLTGAMALRGRRTDWRSGALWGLGGFAAFSLAPAVGLPPELPGFMAAELAARKAWWLAAAFATAGGLALLAFQPRTWGKALGAALLVAPHIVGAPQPPGYAGLVPAELAAQYVAASMVTAGVFWLMLGGLTGHLYRRFG